MTSGNGNAKVEFGGYQVSETYVYWPASWEPAEGEGWYLQADEGTTINQNNVPIPFGDGFFVDCADGYQNDAVLGYAGEVQTTAVPKSFSRIGYSALGNCTPSQITLGDITVDDTFANNTCSISFVSEGNGNAKVMFGGYEVSETYVYWPASWEPASGAGWYLQADEGTTENKNNLPIAAGAGFLVDCADGAQEAIVTIPAAL